MRIAETDQIQESTRHGSFKPLVQFGPRIVMTVDVTAFAGASQQIQVVRPRQQPKVINLRHSGSKELNGAGDQIIIVAAARPDCFDPARYLLLRFRREYRAQ